MLRKLSLIAAAGAGLVLAVTFGQPDGNAHPYVGTLLFRTPTGLFSCSGTLLSPTIVLTAGHCTESGGVVNLRTWVKFTPAITFPGIGGYPSTEAYLDDPANGWISGQAIPHPRFDDYAQFPLTFDVGVVRLSRPVTASTYGELPTEGFLESFLNKRSQSQNRFTVVGYGLQGLIRPFASDKWDRYRGETRLIELKSFTNGGQSAKFTNNPGNVSGGSCFGDSGGPVFYGNSNVVVAVVSFGNTPCIGVDYQFRVDTRVALDFLAPYLP